MTDSQDGSNNSSKTRAQTGVTKRGRDGTHGRAHDRGRGSVEAPPVTDVLVIGRGAAACFRVVKALADGESVAWAPGTQARVEWPMPFFSAAENEPWSRAFSAFQVACTKIGVSAQSGDEGSFVRLHDRGQFRPLSRTEELEAFSDIERKWLERPQFLMADDATTFLKRTAVRAQELLGDRYHRDVSFERVDETHVRLASGETLEARVVFDAAAVGRSRQALIQVLWEHPALEVNAMPGQGVLLDGRAPASGALVLTAYREPKEMNEKRIWGFFSAPTKKGFAESLWTLCSTEEELSDHQAVLRRIRRIRQTVGRCLEKTFGFPEKWTEKLQAESVRVHTEVEWPTQSLIAVFNESPSLSARQNPVSSDEVRDQEYR